MEAKRHTELMTDGELADLRRRTRGAAAATGTLFDAKDCPPPVTQQETEAGDGSERRERVRA